MTADEGPRARMDLWEEHDVFLPLVLGVAAYGQRFDDLLERWAVPAAAETEPGDRESWAGDEQVTFFLLGLAAFRARTRLDIAAAEGPERGDVPAALPLGRGLLR